MMQKFLIKVNKKSSASVIKCLLASQRNFSRLTNYETTQPPPVGSMPIRMLIILSS